MKLNAKYQSINDTYYVLRFFGLGGMLESHKLFDYGTGADLGLAGAEGRYAALHSISSFF
jgi:hypothetical protein